MQLVANKEFVGAFLEEAAPPLRDIEIINCRFESCFTAPRLDFETPAVLSHIRIKSCSYQVCDLYTAFLDDVLIDEFTRSGRHPAFTCGSRFRHVTLKGRIGSPKVLPFPRLGYPEESGEETAIWKAKLARFYAEIDWALDIRHAEFTTFLSFPGVPADRVFFNPEHQVVVERERVLDPGFPYDMLHSLAQIVVDRLITDGFPDLVVAAGMGSKQYKPDLEALDLLRCSGATRPM